MILPIIPYGNDLLRSNSVDIDKNYPKLNSLIKNMFETMVNANGIGISAIQVGININLFIVNHDLATNKNIDLSLTNKKKVFINPKIIGLNGSNTSHREGCLSIPTIFEDIIRPEKIIINYMDENFTEYEQSYSGLLSRVIQHEYDHTIGKLFIDYLSKERLSYLNKKLDLIKHGKIRGPYIMKY